MWMLVLFSHMLRFSLIANVEAKVASDDILLINLLADYFETKNVYFIHDTKGEFGKVIKPVASQFYVTGLTERTQLPKGQNLVVGHSLSDIFGFTKIVEDNRAWTTKWLMITEESIENTAGITIPLNCEFILARKNNDGFELTEVYYIGKTAKLTVKLWGHVTAGKLEGPKLDYLTRRKDLMGYTLKIVAMTVYRVDPDQVFQDKIINFISEALNFTKNTIFSEMGTLGTGRKKSTGLYNIIETSADIASPPFAVTPERLPALNFIWPTSTIKTYMFGTLNEQNDFRSYLTPFADSLWYGLCVWIVLTAIALRTIYKMSSVVSTNRISSDPILDAFRPFCAQGGDVHPDIPVFVSRLMSYLIAMILVPSYSGAILSIITVPAFSLNFEDLNGIISDGHYKLSFIKFTFSDTYFTSNEADAPTTIRDRGLLVREDQLPHDAQEGFQNMCIDKTQVYIDSVAPDPGLRCHILRTHQALFTQSIGLAMAPHSPYTALGIRVVRRVQSAGLADLYQVVKMAPPPEINFTPLDLISVLPLFVIGLILGSMALLVFSIELVVNHFTKRSAALNTDRKVLKESRSDAVLHRFMP